MSNGFILYEGPSMIDGAPIVVIVTGLEGKASRNTKTGAMIQSWVMRSDVAPHVAIKTGQDAAVCGDCNLRPIHAKARGKRRPCYVKVWQAPRSVFDGFKRGIYPRVTADEARALLTGRAFRLGSYGNPSAAPFALWQAATADCVKLTGYIHNWRSASPQWSALVMASVESVQHGLEARKLGYRLFRVRDVSEPLQSKEVMCPASKEAGFKTSCFSCGACGGHSSKARADIAILAH